MSVRVVVGEREPISRALKRLKKQAERAGIPGDIRRKVHFVDGTEVRRAKQFRKRYKSREAALSARISAGLSGNALAEAIAEFRQRSGKP